MWIQTDDGSAADVIALQIMDRTMRVDYRIPEKFKVSPQVVDLLGKMLKGDPAKRITIKELSNDPWFRKDFPESVRFGFLDQ